jgi:hypothetical protein
MFVSKNSTPRPQWLMVPGISTSIIGRVYTLFTITAISPFSEFEITLLPPSSPQTAPRAWRDAAAR